LGGEGVPQLVWVDVPDPGREGGLVDGVVDAGAGDGAAAVGEQQRAVLPVGAVWPVSRFPDI
jgi:hypothetical protein